MLGPVQHANRLTKSFTMTAASLKSCHAWVPRLGAINTKSAAHHAREAD